MSFRYKNAVCKMIRGEVIFPSKKRRSLWVQIHWEDQDGQAFNFVVERFPGGTEADVLGRHSFGCANDCDPGWDGQHIIRVYDGIHLNLYRGELDISRSQDLVRVKAVGLAADTLREIERGGGRQFEIDELIQEMHR